MYHISIHYGKVFLFFDGGVGACDMGTMASPGLLWRINDNDDDELDLFDAVGRRDSFDLLATSELTLCCKASVIFIVAYSL